MFYGSEKEEKTGNSAGGGIDVEVLPTERIRKEYMWDDLDMNS